MYEHFSKRLNTLDKQIFVAYTAACSDEPALNVKRDGLEQEVFKLKQAWADFQLSGLMIRDVLMYMVIKSSNIAFI